ncbi:MAG TPA: hypothetical protein VGH80_07705 [Xanthomonadaceae bacterium]
MGTGPVYYNGYYYPRANCWRDYYGTLRCRRPYVNYNYEPTYYDGYDGAYYSPGFRLGYYNNGYRDRDDWRWHDRDDRRWRDGDGDRDDRRHGHDRDDHDHDR